MEAVRSFNLPVKDMQGTTEFYRRVFDWKIAPVQGSGGDYHRALTAEVDEDEVPLSTDKINGGFFKKGTHGIDSTFLEVEVRSIDETVAKVLKNGGTLIREKMPLMDSAFFAIVRDPEGNFLGLMEFVVHI